MSFLLFTQLEGFLGAISSYADDIVAAYPSVSRARAVQLLARAGSSVLIF